MVLKKFPDSFSYLASDYKRHFCKFEFNLGDSFSLAKVIADFLSSFKQSTTQMTADMWKSTFWQNEMARPDKRTSFLDKVFTRDKGKIHTVKINSLAVEASLSMSG